MNFLAIWRIFAWQFGGVLLGNLAEFRLAIWRSFTWQFGGVLLGNLTEFRLAIWRSFFLALSQKKTENKDANPYFPCKVEIVH